MANLTKPSTPVEGKKIYAKRTNQYPQRVPQSACKVLTAATFCMFVHRAQHFVLERLLPWTVAG